MKPNMKIEECCNDDGELLANLRALAMRESLEAVGRYDPVRVRERFLSTFQPGITKKVLCGQELVGFFVVLEKADHLYLDHLYIAPKRQGQGFGSTILGSVIREAKARGLAVRLGALKLSRSNKFYIAHGFSKTHEEEFDNYYELKVS